MSSCVRATDITVSREGRRAKLALARFSTMSSETDDSTLESAADTAVNQCLALQSDESCAVITDDDCLVIGEALYDAACDITDDAVLVRYPPGDQHGTEPPAP